MSRKTRRQATERVLELGIGTRQTSRLVLELHPEAELVGIDESAEMLAAASADVATADCA